MNELWDADVYQHSVAELEKECTRLKPDLVFRTEIQRDILSRTFRYAGRVRPARFYEMEPEDRWECYFSVPILEHEAIDDTFAVAMRVIASAGLDRHL